MSKLIVFDTETGGTDPQDPTIQIAAVALEDWREIDSFEVKLQFDPTRAEPEALALNSYTPEVWGAEAMPERVALQDFADFCRKYADVRKVSRAGNPYYVARLCGHNVSTFDCPRVWDRMHAYDIFFPADGTPLDTYQLAAWYFHIHPGPEDLRLQTLLGHFGIDPGQAHDALSDVRATAKLAAALLDRITGEVTRTPVVNERRLPA